MKAKIMTLFIILLIITSSTTYASNVNKMPKKQGYNGIFNCGTTLKDALKINNAVKQKVSNLLKYTSWDYQKALILYKFVHNNIKYDSERTAIMVAKLQLGACNIASGAQYAYDSKSGVCFEYATLFAAMAKTAELKVKIDYNTYHMWNEFYDSYTNRWIFVDCTNGLFDENIKDYHPEPYNSIKI